MRRIREGSLRTFCWVVLSLAGIAGTRVLAQGDKPAISARAADTIPALDCLDLIPDSLLKIVPVFAFPVISNKAHAGLLSNAANIIQDLTNRLSSLIAPVDGQIASVDSLISWRDLSAPLIVTWHADGSVTWTVGLLPVVFQPGVDRAGAADLYARLFRLASEANEAFYPRPPQGPRGPVTFEIRFAASTFRADGTPVETRFAHALPAFVVKAPKSVEVVRYVSGRVPNYPDAALRSGSQGSVVVRFMVDTTGKVVMPTFRDLPETRVELMGHYDDFLKAIREAAVGWRFRPARVGNCIVPQIVEQPFGFSLSWPPQP